MQIFHDRREEHFEVVYSASGGITLFYELKFETEGREQTDNDREDMCVMQVVMFPPVSGDTQSTNQQSNNGSRRQSAASVDPFQIAMEVWIEPKLGVCSKGPELLQGLDFLQIASAYLNREHQIITMEASFNRLKQDCKSKTNWNSDDNSGPYRSNRNNSLNIADDSVAVLTKKLFEHTLDDAFKNRMDRLIHVRTTFDITLLLQHSDQKLFHFSLLEPVKDKEANEANDDIIKQLHEPEFKIFYISYVIIAC